MSGDFSFISFSFLYFSISWSRFREIGNRSPYAGKHKKVKEKGNGNCFCLRLFLFLYTFCSNVLLNATYSLLTCRFVDISSIYKLRSFRFSLTISHNFPSSCISAFSSELMNVDRMPGRTIAFRFSTYHTKFYKNTYSPM